LPRVQTYEAVHEDASSAQRRRLTVHTSFDRHGLGLHGVVTSSVRYRYRYRLLATRYHSTRRLIIIIIIIIYKIYIAPWSPKIQRRLDTLQFTTYCLKARQHDYW